MVKSTTFSLSDGILHRIVQAFQLGMMTGTDVADPLKQIRMRPSADDDSVLELTPEYDASFKAMLDRLAERADEIIAAAKAQGESDDADFFQPKRLTDPILSGGV